MDAHIIRELFPDFSRRSNPAFHLAIVDKEVAHSYQQVIAVETNSSASEEGTL